jgi:hypothetical protein
MLESGQHITIKAMRSAFKQRNQLSWKADKRTIHESCALGTNVLLGELPCASTSAKGVEMEQGTTTLAAYRARLSTAAACRHWMKVA